MLGGHERVCFQILARVFGLCRVTPAMVALVKIYDKKVLSPKLADRFD